MRRVSAVVVMLAAALLMHFATPHHSATSPTLASSLAPAVEPEARKLQGPSSVSRAGAASQHHDEMADVIARPPRAVGPEAEPLVVDTATTGEMVISPAPSGTAQPRTARDAWNPGAAIAPTLSTLQTFRC
ncbi:hypothetical protein OG440_39745 (plasmid) [Streptomyces sp. NBC_00637]|uniref:hypothetical protein n=1 Tax=Streptomyces sp. NBC_00637 TaxID=2903667 RepID=UPI00324DA129